MKQLQATLAMFAQLERVPEDISLNTNTMNIIESIGNYCSGIEASIDQHVLSSANDWSTSQQDRLDFEHEANTLKLYVSSVAVGTISVLKFVA